MPVVGTIAICVGANTANIHATTHARVSTTAGSSTQVCRRRCGAAARPAQSQQVALAGHRCTTNTSVRHRRAICTLANVPLVALVISLQRPVYPVYDCTKPGMAGMSVDQPILASAVKRLLNTDSWLMVRSKNAPMIFFCNGVSQPTIRTHVSELI